MVYISFSCSPYLPHSSVPSSLEQEAFSMIIHLTKGTESDEYIMRRYHEGYQASFFHCKVSAQEDIAFHLSSLYILSFDVQHI